MAMRIVVDMASLMGAKELVPITSAHVDGCLFHGESGVLFAETLVDNGAIVKVRSTTNVGALDLLRPDRIRLDAETRKLAYRQMEAYRKMGCEPCWTCAPYQAGHRPEPNEQIAWAESNAVVFANSVLGARTNRYGDFMDIAAAITGRAPKTGLHILKNRRATILIVTDEISPQLKSMDVFYPVLGHWLGQTVGNDIAAIDGLSENTNEDQLKALGAAAAASGSVALFHAVGITPEAKLVKGAFQNCLSSNDLRVFECLLPSFDFPLCLRMVCAPRTHAPYLSFPESQQALLQCRMHHYRITTLAYG